MADSKPQPKTQQKPQARPQVQKKGCCGMENCLESTKMLFLHPTQFFNSVSGVSGYLHVLKFFAVFIIISSLLGLVPSFMLGAVDAFTLGWIVLSILLSVFVAPFIGAAIVHLGVLIVGGKQGFFNTFKANTYSGVVMFLYVILTSILSIIFFALNPGIVETMKNLAALSADTLTDESAAYISANQAALTAFITTFFPFLILISLILLIGVIHTLYAVVVGLSLFQKMSKARALGAVLIAIVIVFAIVMLMGAFIYSLFLSIPNLSPLSAGPF